MDASLDYCSKLGEVMHDLILSIHPFCRNAQQAAEAAAAQESQRLRRLAAQEALLKETFLEAVEAEKERLLLARERGLQGQPATAPQGRSTQPQVCPLLLHPAASVCFLPDRDAALVAVSSEHSLLSTAHLSCCCRYLHCSPYLHSDFQRH